MSYVALARRYRPQVFADVVGQSHITETLSQAIAAGRVAPAYLFTGPRGCGKTTVARIVAKAVNCNAPKNGEPDGKCESCESITDGRSLDVMEIDGASNNSVDDVRVLRENVGYAASAPGKRKVYIVDEVHMLSPGAFNALLKTVEEPPPHVLFIFATTDPRKVPATVVSRCQRFDFRRLQTAEIRDRLAAIAKKEKLAVDAEAAFLVAKRADGSLRDGLSLLDQVVSSCSSAIGVTQVAEVLGLVPIEAYLELTRAIVARDAKRGLAVLHGVLAQGADPSDFALGLVEHLRNLLLLGVDPGLETAVQLGDAHLTEARTLAAEFKMEDLLHLMNRAAALYEEVRRSPQPIVGLEAALVEMTRFESRVVLADLLERLGGTPGDAPRPGPGGGTTTRVAPPTASAPVAPSGRSPVAATPPRRGTPRGAADADATIMAALDVRTTIAAGGPPLGVAERPAARLAADNVATASVDLDFVQARWQTFTSELRATKAFLSVCLAEGRPVRLAGGAVELWFPPEHAFHLHAVQDAIKTREIEPYLATFFGQPLKLALTTEAGPAGDAVAWGSPSGLPLAAPADDSAVDSDSPPAPSPSAARTRLTRDDIAQSRRQSIDDVVRDNPGIDAIIDAFDGEVLEDPGS